MRISVSRRTGNPKIRGVTASQAQLMRIHRPFKAMRDFRASFFAAGL